MVKSLKKKKKNRYYLYYMIFIIFLNCFFPSFNSKIETWLICEAQAQVLQWITSKSIQSFCALKKFKPNRIQQAQPNTQIHPPKTKTLISGVRYSIQYTTRTKKKKNLLLMRAYPLGSIVSVCGLDSQI